MEFVISAANHSFQMVRRSRECVTNLPTTSLIGEGTRAEHPRVLRRLRMPAL
jgi:hypothetical protein